MKKLLYILLFAPLALFGQEEDPCYSVIDFILQTEVENPSLEVNLVAGWNMIGYPCSQDMLLTYGFSSIENDIAIVKDNNGNVYLPEFSFNGIGFLEGGQGYQVKMNEFVMGFTFCQSIQFPTIEGCTNCEAVNFNQWANVDDGSCIAVFLGCTDEIALNYNSEANTDNSSCLYYECTDSLACNYDEISNQEDGSCEYPLEEDLDCDGNPLINCYYPPDPEFVSLLQGNTEGVMNGDCLDIDADFVYVQSLGINDSNISNLDGIQYFTNLSYLYIEHNDGLTSIPDLSGLTNLSSLYILNNAALTSLPELSGLTNLSEVFIYGNDGLTSLLQLSGLTNLSTLEIFGNNALTNLPELSGLTNLSTLEILGNNALTSLTQLSGLTNLSNLYIDNNDALTSLPELSGLTNLSYLNIQSNDALTSLPELSGLTNLSYLNIEHNDGLTSIPDLSGLTNLSSLYILNNAALTSLPELSGLTNLSEVFIYGNDGLTSLLQLSGLTNLSYLNIQSNDALTNLPELSGLTNLSYLYINNNFALTSLPELSGLTNLSNLYIEHNDGLTSIPDLSGLTNLSSLYINNNDALTSLPELSGLTNLDTLGIHNNDWLECVGDYPEQLTIQESWPPVCETTYQVGDLAEGGIVFYIDETGEHGLIASVGEISEGAYSGPAVTYGYEWGCYATEVNGADDNFLGSGLQNSLDITYQNCTPNSNSEYITAADAAISYVYEGFDDWYLPSIDELNLLNSVFELNGKHWSSTEMNLHNAHTVGWSAQAFQAGDAKIYANKVRPIRSF